MMMRVVIRRCRGAAGLVLLAAAACDGCELRLNWAEVSETSTGGGASSGVVGSSSSEEEESSGGADEAASSEEGSTSTGAASLCGNGDIDEGEACDDGNKFDDDWCPSGDVGRCKAYGHCGDGILRTGPEECDDGNLLDNDACPSGEGKCKIAYCGDSFRWTAMEECDDGNAIDSDKCLNSCKDAACGDGFVWDGEEECDDGNRSDADACPSGFGGCHTAYCGDGFLQEGVEQCEHGITDEPSQCKECSIARYVFVTGTMWTGQLGGLDGADEKCRMAAEGVLEGNYRAWLGSEFVGGSPSMWMDDFSGAFVTPCNGIVVANGWEGIVSEELSGGIDCDEHGSMLQGERAWTNVRPNGLVLSSFEDCGGWNSEFIEGNVGLVGALDESWTDNKMVYCDEKAHLYCFQVDD